MTEKITTEAVVEQFAETIHLLFEWMNQQPFASQGSRPSGEESLVKDIRSEAGGEFDASRLAPCIPVQAVSPLANSPAILVSPQVLILIPPIM